MSFSCNELQLKADKLDVLLEVTSPVDLSTCKSVMDELIRRMLEAGFHSSHMTSAPAATADDGGKQELVIEQVRVINSEGQLKVVFPSRVDLQFDSVKVIYQEKE